MRYPEEVRKLLKRRYDNNHRSWLEGSIKLQGSPATDPWPMKISLGIPTEKQAQKQFEEVRDWVTAWQSWQGPGSLDWYERHWHQLGTQLLPDQLLLTGPEEVSRWVGEAQRWDSSRQRYRELVERWPQLATVLPRHFNALADYSEVDYRRLVDTIAWIQKNPDSGLYPRQLPISGLDSKWLEKRKRLITDLVNAIQDAVRGEIDFYTRCGLRMPPQLLRIRVLDEEIRCKFGGLTDLSAPPEQLAALDVDVRSLLIIENQQTGLALDELPGTVVIMQLGYGVDVLKILPWAKSAHCFYWGDLDTHGFAILNRARHILPQLQSVLMDESTLLGHRDLWVEEKDQHGAETLPQLTDSEQAVYQSLKSNVWGRHVRLEQERIEWDLAWKILQRSVISPQMAVA